MARPTKMTQETIAKLEEAFAWGCTDIEACLHAGITVSTLYRHHARNSEFLDRNRRLQAMPTLTAKKVILEAIEAGNVFAAHKVLDRVHRREVSAKARRDRMASPEWTLLRVVRSEFSESIKAASPGTKG